MAYYHGTERRRGCRFIKNKSMELSIGDEHWLGDGIYFYTELFYAYRWICLMYKKKYGNDPDETSLFSKYMVLSAVIKIERKRIFDLSDNIEHILKFNELCDCFNEKNKKTRKYKNIKIIDGVVLNILFKEFEWNKRYDAVLCSFNTHNTRSSRIAVSEKQLCVKNPNVVSEIKEIFEYNFENNSNMLYRYNRIKGGKINDNGGIGEKYKKIFGKIVD